MRMRERERERNVYRIEVFFDSWEKNRHEIPIFSPSFPFVFFLVVCVKPVQFIHIPKMHIAYQKAIAYQIVIKFTLFMCMSYTRKFKLLSIRVNNNDFIQILIENLRVREGIKTERWILRFAHFLPLDRCSFLYYFCFASIRSHSLSCARSSSRTLMSTCRMCACACVRACLSILFLLLSFFASSIVDSKFE